MESKRWTYSRGNVPWSSVSGPPCPAPLHLPNPPLLAKEKMLFEITPCPTLGDKWNTLTPKLKTWISPIHILSFVQPKSWGVGKWLRTICPGECTQSWGAVWPGGSFAVSQERIWFILRLDWGSTRTVPRLPDVLCPHPDSVRAGHVHGLAYLWPLPLVSFLCY